MQSRENRYRGQASKSRLCRAMVICAVCAAILLAGTVGINLYIYGTTRAQILPADDAAAWGAEKGGADCILVLGAGVRADGSPSPMLADRIAAGVALYQNGAAPKLLMSGDHGSAEYDEVNCMKRVALAADVAEADIFLDHAGFSTAESLRRAKAVFGVRRVIVVTQEYHLYRALYIARSLGIDAVGVAADAQPYRGQAIRELREFAARVKDFGALLLPDGRFVPGEPVDITGDGRVTNG